MGDRASCNGLIRSIKPSVGMKDPSLEGKSLDYSNQP